MEEERKGSGHKTSVLYVGQQGDDSTLIVNRARTETECSFVLNIYSEAEKYLVADGPLTFLRALDEEQANLN